MRNKNYSQQLPPEMNGNQSQSLPSIYTNRSEEGDEGGLNIGGLLASVRRRIVIVALGTASVAAAAVFMALTSPPSYVAKFELLTEPVTAEDKVVSSSRDEDQKEDSTSSNEVDETKLKVLQSPKLMEPITQKVQMYYPGSSTPQLDIKILPNTKILEVSYKDPNPEKVRFVLNTASEIYLKYSLEERQTDTKLAIKFVDDQLPKLQQRVELLQGRLRGFRQQNNIVNADIQSQQLANQLDQVTQKQIDNRIQLTRTRAFYTSLQKQLRLQEDVAEAISALSESPRYQKLLDQLQDIEAKIAAKSAQYREDSPSVQVLRIQKQNLLPLIVKEERRILGNKLSKTTVGSLDSAAPNSSRLREIQKFLDAAKQMQVLEAQNQALNQAESSLRQRVKQFPAILIQKDDLERQLKIASDNLNHFLTEREALQIDAAQKQVPWQILTPPNEPQNIAPSVQRNLILGTALGLLLSVGFALLIDKFNNVFYNPEEVKDKIKLPVVGEIPHIKLSKDGKPSQKHDISEFWESFRSLYTNICFLSFTESIRSLAIISAAPGDGKSTIVLHLAQTAAAMGRRVLLVDANLRNPTIHTMLGLSNTEGLSNLIAEGLNYQTVIKRSRSRSTQIQDNVFRQEIPETGESLLENNLFILTAGQIPPNPTILLASPKMQSLAEQFQQEFDLVIYDTSHLLGFADTSLLTSHTDASILAVGIGKTNRSVLLKALEQLNFSSTPVLGLIANGI